MSDPSFFRPLLPDKFRILGLELKPLSLGHVHLLEAIESPFLFGGQQDLEDLVAGVFICSRGWKSNLWHLKHRRLHALYEWVWQKAVGNFDVWDKKILFSEYLAEAYERPIYRINVGENDPQPADSGAPLSATIRVALMADLGFAESELWDRPWAKCVMDWMTLKATRGEISFPGITKQDVAAAKDLAEKLAEKIRNGEIKIPKK